MLLQTLIDVAHVTAGLIRCCILDYLFSPFVATFEKLVLLAIDVSLFMVKNKVLSI